MLLWLSGSEPWDSPVSFRKPALFGLSTGLTLWSCLWVFRQLPLRSHITWLSRALTAALLLEVGLITLQTWRGVPSHFNRQTFLDASIESALLGLITLATAIIFWLSAVSLRSPSLKRLLPHVRLATRAGLGLLSLSCLIGFLITGIGSQLISEGLSPETYPRRGVLKFPHGAALHAIQTLVILACCATRLRSAWPIAVVSWAIFAHLLGLLYAILQTFRGRARFELDLSATLLLLATGVCLALSIGLLFWRGAREQSSHHSDAG